MPLLHLNAGDRIGAAGHRPGAAFPEQTAGSARRRRWNRSRDCGQPFYVRISDIRQAGQQPLGIGMQGAGKKIVMRGVFDNLPGVHDGDMICHVEYHSQIMRNQGHPHISFSRQTFEQNQYLPLNGHIQGCGRLVSDQKLRRTRQRHGDHNPLPQTAGKLMRVFTQPLTRNGESHGHKKLHRPFPCFSAGNPLMLQHRLHHLPAYREHWVKRGHGLLKNHTDLSSSDCAQLTLTHARQPDIVQANLPFKNAGVFR